MRRAVFDLLCFRVGVHVPRAVLFPFDFVSACYVHRRRYVFPRAVVNTTVLVAK